MIKAPLAHFFAGPRIVSLFLAVLGLFIILPNLGGQSLWQDEAQTALVAKTILTHGIPLGTDGVNNFSQDLGAEFGKGYVWTYHPWIPFYVLAFFFKIFGVSTFVARLPFALIGVAIVVLMYHYYRKYVGDGGGPLVAAGLLAFSVPFLLLTRQCRYYSPAILFSLLCLWSFSAIIEKKKYARIGFLLASLLLFHTHYLHYFCFMIAVGVYVALRQRALWKEMLFPMALSMVLVLPWLLYVSSTSNPLAFSTPESHLSVLRFWSFISYYTTQMLKHLVPLWAIPAAIGILIAARVKYGSDEAKRMLANNTIVFLLIYGSATLVIMAFSSTAPPHFRHIAPLIPVIAIMLAWIIALGARVHVIAGATMLLGLVVTQPLPKYLYELTHDFAGPIDGIVHYLHKHGTDRDTVVITYGDLPVKFYTPMRVLGGFTGEDVANATSVRWIILRKYTLHPQRDRALKTHLLGAVDWSNYRRVAIGYPDTPFENRESPDDHLYRTAANEDSVVIFQRIDSRIE